MINMDWNVISFSDDKGIITEYLATRKGLSYFSSEYNPKLYASGLSKDQAFTLEGDLNRIIEFNEV
jgi:hypothetical protein